MAGRFWRSSDTVAIPREKTPGQLVNVRVDRADFYYKIASPGDIVDVISISRRGNPRAQRPHMLFKKVRVFAKNYREPFIQLVIPPDQIRSVPLLDNADTIRISATMMEEMPEDCATIHDLLSAE